MQKVSPDFGLVFKQSRLCSILPKPMAHMGEESEPPNDLVPILETAFRKGGVHLIIVPVDYSENQRVLD